jgi:hypothetical protein
MLLDQNGNVIKVKVPQQHMLEYLGTIAAFWSTQNYDQFY